VQRYLQNFPPPYPAEIWNSTGRARGFPDISANGYVIILVLVSQEVCLADKYVVFDSGSANYVVAVGDF
jgi:hypothetical protein